MTRALPAPAAVFAVKFQQFFIADSAIREAFP
jgi:hypothetical protein